MFLVTTTIMITMFCCHCLNCNTDELHLHSKNHCMEHVSINIFSDLYLKDISTGSFQHTLAEDGWKEIGTTVRFHLQPTTFLTCDSLSVTCSWRIIYIN